MSLPASAATCTGDPALAVAVCSRVFGGGAGEGEAPPVLLRLLDERLTVAELIRRTVEEQVRELLVRRRLDAAQVRRALDRQYLTSEEVAAQAGQDGAVRFRSPRMADASGIDAEAEVKRALEAFRRRAYAIFVSGRQVEGPDESLSLAPGTRVTFLRLTPLAGG